MRSRRIGWIAAFVAAMAALAGCGPRGPTEVHVTMSEWTMVMDQTSIPAGEVRFLIENVGAEKHEVVLERAGALDEPMEAEGEESEVEDVEPATSATLEWTIDEPGQYQLACHIVEEELGQTQDHYANGMVVTFTVTP